MTKNISFLKNYGSNADFWSVYVLKEYHEELGFRKSVQEPISTTNDSGALLTVMKNGGIGYASTPNLSEEGIKRAFDQAFEWAEYFAKNSLLKNLQIPFAAHQDSYIQRPSLPLSSAGLAQKLEILREADEFLRENSLIIDSSATLWSIESYTTYENSRGAKIEQEIHRAIPSLSATACKNDVTQVRTLGGMRAFCQQGGMDFVLNLGLSQRAREIAQDAIDLASAPNCPSGIMDVLIDPDQMMLQIHESIGHPLELDRILGDERNYAGTSFVSLDMFGSYQYGSDILNVSFDPTIKEEFASYAYDDEGQKAQKEYIIKNGLLVRPLGAAFAQERADMAGVANARSSSWNRPPIDRMANLNIEPGESTFEEMLSSIERGVYLKSNSSWSIDDSRNKFQFGCEWGQLIENGKLTHVVRNPNYRGVSAQFWRNLYKVGDISTRQVMGTPYCGKGEPNQCIRVGHASPVCLFKNIDVFGGE
jgi:predicted Zn-dependent protease